MPRRILLLAVLACGLVAAPAFSLRPYRPEPVDFESGAGVQKRFGRAVQSQPIKTGKRFNLVGLRWRGDAEPRVAVRTRREGGGWSRWTTLPAHSEDAPDPGRGEPMPQGSSTPTWVGEADYVQYRLSKPVPGLKLHYVNVKGSSTAADRLRSGLRRVADDVAALIPGTPAARAADAAARTWSPAPAGAPRTARPRSARLRLRQGRLRPPHGLGQRLLAQRGALGGAGHLPLPPQLQRLERHRLQLPRRQVRHALRGPRRRVDRAVVGAQAQGYNSQTTGIANIGTHTSVPQSSAALDAMARLIRWKLPLHGAPTAGTTTVTSAGGDTNRSPPVAACACGAWPATATPTLTECPGDALYAQLRRPARAGGRRVGGAGTQLTAKLTPAHGRLQGHA